MQDSSPFITVVSGYPRSGTSMMMQMLHAGGLPALYSESFRPADERNPRGYYELEAALKMGSQDQTTDWVAEARGKAVKVIAYQLKYLPAEFDYRIIFMRRRVADVIASSGDFKLLNKESPLSEQEKLLAYKTEYVIYEAWLLKQRRLPSLFLSYNDLLESPAAPVARICHFLGLPLDAEKMIAAIDPALYRNRSSA